MLSTAQIKTKALITANLLTLIDLTAFDTQVEYVKFNFLFPDTPTSPTEVIYKVSNGTPSLPDDLKLKQLQAICKEFSSAYDFSISTSTVLHFSLATNKWDEDRQVMVLTPRPVEIVEEVPNISEEVTEVSTTQEDKQDSNVLTEEVFVNNSTNTESLPLVVEQDTTTILQAEKVPLVEEVIEQVAEVSNKPIEVVAQPTNTSTNKSLNIYVARTNSEGLTQKILIEDMFASELLGIIKPWLVAIDRLSDFKQELQETKHNSIVLYLNPSYEWEIREVTRKKEVTLLDSFLEDTEEIREKLGVKQFSQELFDHLKDVENWKPEELIQAHAIKGSVECNGEFHLKTTTRPETTFKPFKRDISSAYVAQISNRSGTDIQRKRKEAVPELGSLQNITPILVERIYLAQSYILFDPQTLEHSREIRRIAVQDGGKFYYFSDLSEEDRNIHNIEPFVEAIEGKEIIRDCEDTKKVYFTDKYVFPDLSIQMVTFESLDSDGNTLKLQHYQKTSGVWVIADAITSEDNLAKDQNGNKITDLRFVAAPVAFLGFQHPNVKVKESFRNEDGHFAISSTQPPKSVKKARLSNLSDARLVAQNSLEWMGFLSNVPCIVNLVNSHDHWQLEALPIQEIPSYPLLYCLAAKYIEGYWQQEDLDNQIIVPLDKEMSRLEEMSSKTQDTLKLEKIGRRITNLQKLRKAVLSREKLDSKVVSECTEIVKNAIKSASYRPSITDKYYSRYILAQVYFLSTNESEITYLLDDFMSHKRQATQVISALRWLTRVPNNLQKQFPKQKPSVQELRDFLYPKFNESFAGVNPKNPKAIAKFSEVELIIRENNKKIFFDVLHHGKLQLTQVLTIKMPVSDGKNRGKVSTKVNGTPNFSDRSVFEKFLKTKDGRFVAECQNQLRHLVNVFLSRNFNTLVGEEKVGHQRKVSEIIGFERSKSGWSEIKRGFVKHLLPYSSDSEIRVGKLIYLATNQVLSSQDLELLVIQIAENWSKWNRKDLQRIKIGGSSSKATDPEILVHVLTKKILSGNFQEDLEAWQDTLNWFAEVCKATNKEYKSVGFRFENGIILTPDCIYDNQIEKWEHRIKLQLANLLLDSSRGNIEAWLDKSVDYLYESLEKVKSGWDSVEKHQSVKEHLANLHDCHGRCLEIERSKAIY